MGVAVVRCQAVVVEELGSGTVERLGQEGEVGAAFRVFAQDGDALLVGRVDIELEGVEGLAVCIFEDEAALPRTEGCACVGECRLVAVDFLVYLPGGGDGFATVGLGVVGGDGQSLVFVDVVLVKE